MREEHAIQTETMAYNGSVAEVRAAQKVEVYLERGNYYWTIGSDHRQRMCCALIE